MFAYVCALGRGVGSSPILLWWNLGQGVWDLYEGGGVEKAHIVWLESYMSAAKTVELKNK